MRRFLLTCAVMSTWLVQHSVAQQLRVPDSVSAGSEATVSTTGSGSATFYLLGPGTSRKSEIRLGDEIHIPATSIEHAGQYLAILCSGSCRSARFTVTPAQPRSLVFLVHPSRVPVGLPDAVTGVAVPFDRFDNLILAPVAVRFEVNGGNASLFSRTASTSDGIGWFRTSSGKSAGPLRVGASIDGLNTQRVVQEVASEPCHLRIKGERTAKAIVVETDPVRDCAGNPVSDGTIVTFTAAASDERSTVDAPLKRGIARVEFQTSQPVTISAACGVAMGNELRIGASR